MALFCISSSKIPTSNPISFKSQNTSLITNIKTHPAETIPKTSLIPTMVEIMDASKSQNIHLRLQTLGPFFRISAKSLETEQEVGRAEGLIRVWFEGRVLHLDSIRMKKQSLGMERSIFGLGLFLGAVAIRHGFDCGCRKAELLAINDTQVYHSKLVRFYGRMGFRVAHEVNGSSIGDMAHMLVWGGKGTRMDAYIEQLLIKWGGRFKAPRGPKDYSNSFLSKPPKS